MNLAFQNILISTDFSQAGRRAFVVAANLCTKFGSALHILHVLESPNMISASSTTKVTIAHNGASDQEARRMLCNLRESVMKDYNIPVRIHMPTGISFEEICRSAAEIPADLVIMGTHGSSGAREFLIGTTAYNVIKNTPRPVLTIPGKLIGDQFTKILFTVRPVSGIKEKYDLIEPLLKLADVSLNIVILSPGYNRKLVGQYEEELQDIITTLKRTEIKYDIQEYRCNNFASKVLELSDKLKADLIAINATLIYKDTKFYVDPYTRQVVNHAKIPVLSFRNEKLIQ